MALQSSGAISLSQIDTENTSVNYSSNRSLIGLSTNAVPYNNVTSAPYGMKEFYGYTHIQDFTSNEIVARGQYRPSTNSYYQPLAPASVLSGYNELWVNRHGTSMSGIGVVPYGVAAFPDSGYADGAWESMAFMGWDIQLMTFMAYPNIIYRQIRVAAVYKDIFAFDSPASPVNLNYGSSIGNVTYDTSPPSFHYFSNNTRGGMTQSTGFGTIGSIYQNWGSSTTATDGVVPDTIQLKVHRSNITNASSGPGSSGGNSYTLNGNTSQYLQSSSTLTDYGFNSDISISNLGVGKSVGGRVGTSAHAYNYSGAENSYRYYTRADRFRIEFIIKKTGYNDKTIFNLLLGTSVSVSAERLGGSIE